MKRILAGFLLAACGTGAPIATPALESPSPIATESVIPPTGSVSTSSPIVPPTIAILGERVTTPPTLADGRPSTFLAVTDDYAAVEVDTLTGDIVRFLGQVSTAEELANAECGACANGVDGVWRTADGETFYISECCEPAGGAITVLTGDEVMSPDQGSDLGAWSIVPSPSTDLILMVGYQTAVADREGRLVAPLFDNDGGGVAAIGWSNQADRVFWIEFPWYHGDGIGSATLTSYELSTGKRTVFKMPWLEEDSYLIGLGGQASGNLVSFQVEADHSTRGVVIDPTGTLVTTFAVEDGSTLGGYDPSGRFLIYVDGAGVVRWQGLGGSGELGRGFKMASW